MKTEGERLLSLDVARGITVMGMLIASNPGSERYVYGQLLHAEWNGLTIADLGFPSFLFIAGIAITFSLGGKLEHHIDRASVYKKVVFRSAALFAIGLFLEIYPFFRFDPFRMVDLSTLRIMGVLQRIAICYLLGSVIYVEFKKSSQLASWLAVILTGYWLLLITFPQAGMETGVLDKETNLVALIDQTILGDHVLTPGWEPLGLLSSFSATASVLIGVIAGNLIRSDRPEKEKPWILFGLGLALASLGLVIDPWFPFNKELWSSSYALVTGGCGLIIFSVIYWTIEVRNCKKWIKPFVVFGKNALIVFIFSAAFTKLVNSIIFPDGWGNGSIRDIIYFQVLMPVSDPFNASLLYALLSTIFWLAVMWLLYSRKVFIKI